MAVGSSTQAKAPLEVEERTTKSDVPHVFRNTFTWVMCSSRGFRACEPAYVLGLNMSELPQKLCCHFGLEVYSMEHDLTLQALKQMHQKLRAFFCLYHTGDDGRERETQGGSRNWGRSLQPRASHGS